MNLSERLPWVCWAQVYVGTNPSDSPSRTLVGSSHCPYSPGLSSGDLLTRAGHRHGQAPSATHRLQLELSSFLRKHDVMNLAEHLIKSTNTADAFVAGNELLPCPLPLWPQALHHSS